MRAYINISLSIYFYIYIYIDIFVISSNSVELRNEGEKLIQRVAMPDFQNVDIFKKRSKEVKKWGSGQKSVVMILLFS